MLYECPLKVIYWIQELVHLPFWHQPCWYQHAVVGCLPDLIKWDHCPLRVWYLSHVFPPPSFYWHTCWPHGMLCGCPYKYWPTAQPLLHAVGIGGITSTFISFSYLFYAAVPYLWILYWTWCIQLYNCSTAQCLLLLLCNMLLWTLSQWICW